MPVVVAVDLVAQRVEQLLIVPSSSFSAMLPVKPSVTTTSAAPRSRSRALGVAAEVRAAVVAEQLVRLDRQLVALLVLLADREQPHLGVRARRAAPG